MSNAAFQHAGKELERQLIDFMMQFSPAEEPRVRDVATIAREARRLAWDLFSEAARPGGYDGPTGAD